MAIDPFGTSVTTPSVVPSRPANRSQDVFDESNRATLPSGSSSETFYQQGTQPIKDMQTALVTLSNDMMSHPIQRQDASSTANRDVDPFMNFLVTSYMSQSPIKGKQTAKANIDAQTQMGTATESDNFKEVLNSISHIGSATAAQKPDGIWGEKTNNALKQVYALGHMLLQTQRTMQLKTDYKDDDLAKFAKFIPEHSNDFDLNLKLRIAPFIVQDIGKLKSLYDSFKQQVLDNPARSALITGTKPLISGKNVLDTRTGLDDAHTALFAQYKDTPLSVTINKVQTKITPADLVGINAFNQYVRQNAKTLGLGPSSLNDQAIMKQLLADIKTSTGIGVS